MDSVETALAEALRDKMLKVLQDWCDVANEAHAAGFIMAAQVYLDPEGKHRTVAPTISKVVKYEPGTR